MSNADRLTPIEPLAGAGERLAQLHGVAALVRTLGGPGVSGSVPQTNVTEVDRAYDNGSTLARFRFDQLAERTAGLAAAGIEAILAADPASSAAIEVLAAELDREIARLETLVAARAKDPIS